MEFSELEKSNLTDNTCINKGATRIERFIHHIRNARSEDMMEFRITNYITAMESIVSTSEYKKKEKTSISVATIISTNIDEYKTNYKRINEIYDIRSQYVHGDHINKTSNEMTEISIYCDIVNRILCKYFMNDPVLLEYLENNEIESIQKIIDNNKLHLTTGST